MVARTTATTTARAKCSATGGAVAAEMDGRDRLVMWKWRPSAAMAWTTIEVKYHITCMTLLMLI